MAVEHDFTHPRNLYEKLERDSEKLNSEINGDNFYNFITTACHLQSWIKNEDGMKNDAVVKRLLKRIHDDPNVRICEEILSAKRHFTIRTDIITNDVVVDFGDEKVNVIDLKNEILGIYQTYFHVK